MVILGATPSDLLPHDWTLVKSNCGQPDGYLPGSSRYLNPGMGLPPWSSNSAENRHPQLAWVTRKVS